MAPSNFTAPQPLALNARLAKQMVDTAKRKKHKLAVHFNHRAAPQVQVLKEYHDAGDFGDVYFARLKAHGEVVSENRHFFMNFKSIKLPEAKVKHTLKHRADGSATVTLRTDNYAHLVHLDVPAAVRCSDNFFDLIPGRTKTVTLIGKLPRARRLKVTWLNQ